MNELALFAGSGGGILGGRLLGWHTVGAVEIEEYPRKVLLHQQELGNLPQFPIWDDVCSFDGRPWRGLVDVVSGGFPCQDISCAGKGAGIEGSRSGLWAEMHRIICEVRPRYAFMENSPMLTSRGLGRVLGDLAEIGYDAAWLVLGAADVGAPHRRDRIWILALDSDTYGVQCPEQGGEHSRTERDSGRGAHKLEAGSGMDWNSNRVHEQTLEKICGGQTPEPVRSSGDGAADANISDTAGERLEAVDVHTSRDAGVVRETPDWASRRGVQPPLLPDSDMSGCQEQRSAEPAAAQYKTTQRSSWWSFEPRVGRVADGVASRVDRLKSLGNGQVPLVAATAFQILKHRLNNIQS